jgi:hypothetical protein
MSDVLTEETNGIFVTGTRSSLLVPQKIIAGVNLGRSPLKLVTGIQSTGDLTFHLQPGSVVAHPGSTVIFVCG